MKNFTFLFFFILGLTVNSQSIYKGLEFGMDKKEAIAAFKADRDQYTTVDIGNGFTYRIYQQNFVYQDKKLAAVMLSPKGSAFGMSYDTARNYLIHTRGFFENLGYETFIDNEYWNAPLNYASSGSKWGLILTDADKTKVVQLFPMDYTLNNAKLFSIVLKVWHFKTWMDLYHAENEVQYEKIENSGF